MRDGCGRTAVALLVLLGLAGAPARAHDFTITDTFLVVRGDGHFTVDLVCDLDALATGVPSGTGSVGHEGRVLAWNIARADEEQRQAFERVLTRLFERRVRIRLDGEPIRHRVSFPDRRRVEEFGEVEPGAEEPPVTGTPESFFGVTARLEGQIPAGTGTMTFFASRAFQSVHLTVAQQRAERVRRQVLGVGEESAPIELLIAAPGTQGTGTAPGLGEGDLAAAGDDPFSDYFRLGFVHIVPRGLDHMLFVLGLCLLGSGWRQLAVWVTCFTLGHSLSLGLASRGLMSASPSVVEPAIALSIGWVALQAVRASRRADRSGTAPAAPSSLRSEALLVSLLGLLHGFGFAGVLAELGLPGSSWLPALLGFNLGVEAGQLVVLAAGVALLAAAGGAFGRGRVVIVVGAALIAVSLFWTVERLGLLPA